MQRDSPRGNYGAEITGEDMSTMWSILGGLETSQKTPVNQVLQEESGKEATGCTSRGVPVQIQ